MSPRREEAETYKVLLLGSRSLVKADAKAMSASSVTSSITATMERRKPGSSVWGRRLAIPSDGGPGMDGGGRVWEGLRCASAMGREREGCWPAARLPVRNQ